MRKYSSYFFLTFFLGIGGIIMPGNSLIKAYRNEKKSEYLLYTFQLQPLVSIVNVI